MRFARAAMLAVTVMLLAQTAFAFDKKPTPKASPKPSPAVTPAPTYVPKLSYCFVPKVAKPTIAALCPPGFTLVAAENRCKKDAGYECPEGYTLTIDAFGAAVCKYCKTFFKLNAAGKCALQCKAGYKLATIKGVPSCVEECKEGFYSTGSACISTKKQYTPKTCSDKLCLPKFQLYYIAASNSTSGRKLMNAAPTPAAPAKKCVCALTDPINVYEQPCHDPYLKAATKVTKYETAVCPKDIMPVAGVCNLPCPSNCYETLKGECEYPCPAGSIACKTKLFNKICVKGSASYAKSNNVCEQVKKIKLDKGLLCPVPSPAPVPSPNWKPAPAPKPSKFDKELPDLSKIVDKVTGAVKGAVTEKVENKLG